MVYVRTFVYMLTMQILSSQDKSVYTSQQHVGKHKDIICSEYKDGLQTNVTFTEPCEHTHLCEEHECQDCVVDTPLVIVIVVIVIGLCV